MFGKRIRSGRAPALLSAFLALASLFTGVMPSAAQTDDPLALKTYLPGHDAEKSRAVLAEHMVGTWQVVHMDSTDTPRTGQAQISADGNIKLTLLSRDGETHYDLVEADAQHFDLADGPFSGSLTARFRKISTGVDDDPEHPIDVKTTLSLPSSASSLQLEKDLVELDLPIVWRDGHTPHLQVSLAVRDDTDRYEGQWNEEKAARLQTGGLATWVRGSPRIDQVFVVEDQLDPTSGKVYPFTPDMTERGDPQARQRTLLVIGDHLPEMSDQVALASQSDAITYAANFKSGMDRDQAITETLARVEYTPAADADMLLVTAQLEPGVTGGQKALTVNGAQGTWNLLFSDGFARFSFARGEGEASDVFYEGDIGYVELHLVEDIPIGAIELELFVGRDRPMSAGVVLARRTEDQGDEVREGVRYRSDPIHFYSRTDQTLTPPEDRDALRVGVTERTIVRAVPTDPTQIVTVPRLAEAKIEKYPLAMGEVWRRALDRVADCSKTTVDDHQAFQNQPFGSVDNFIVWDQAEEAYKFVTGKGEEGAGGFGSRSIQIENGDMAAAILIRDELVSGSLGVIGDLRRQASDPELMRAARKRARDDPAIAENLFWSTSSAPFLIERTFLPDTNMDYTLDYSLDVEWIAERHDISIDEATAWAEQRTTEAALAYIDQIQSSMSTALDAGDCEIDALFEAAGHRAPTLVNAILPRLMKFQRDPERPANGHWVPDRIAQGYVKGLHSKVGSVRALEDYAEADTRVVTTAIAAATGAFGLGAQALRMGAVGFWAMITEVGIELGLGLVDAYDYYQGERYFEYAKGAAPASGEDIYYQADAERGSLIATGVGLIMPALSGASATQGLRHFKTVRRGKELLDNNPGVLSRLEELSDAEREGLAAYYTNLMHHSKSRLSVPLNSTEQEALDAFKDYFRNARNFDPEAARAAEQVADSIDAARQGTLADPPASMDDSFDQLNIGTLDNPANTGGTRPATSDRPTSPDLDDSFDQLNIGTPDNPVNTGGTRPTGPDAPRSSVGNDSFEQLDLGPPDSPLGTRPSNPDTPGGGVNNDSFAELDLGPSDSPLGTRPADPNGPSSSVGDETVNVPPPTGDPRLDPTGKRLKDVVDSMPVDDSPSLPRPDLAETDLSTLEPGLISRNLTDEQVLQLFDPLYEPLPHEIILKADLIRAGKVPLGYANGDPDTLDALAKAFGLEPGWRRPNLPNDAPRSLSTSGESTIIDPPPGTVGDTTLIEAPPATSGNTTIIESPPGPTRNTTLIESPPGSSRDADSNLIDTVTLPPPGSDTVVPPQQIETVRPSSGAEQDLIDTIALPRPGSDTVAPSQAFGTISPPGTGPAPYQPPPISNPQVQAQLELVHRRQMQDLLNGVPGTYDRQTTLGTTRRILENARPEDLQIVASLDQAMRRLGVGNERSLNHAALFHRTKNYNASKAFSDAQTIANGVLRYGSRPVSMAEFVETTGISPLAARAAADEAARANGLHPTRTSIVPFAFR